MGSSPASPVLENPSHVKGFQGRQAPETASPHPFPLGKKPGKTARIDHDQARGQANPVPPSVPWLSRQNAALKRKRHGVTLDVAGARMRLRATMPPRPANPLGTGLRQHRISTGLVYPNQASEALQLAEQLSNALERHRLGLRPLIGPPSGARGSVGARHPPAATYGCRPHEALTVRRGSAFRAAAHRRRQDRLAPVPGLTGRVDRALMGPVGEAAVVALSWLLPFLWA